MLKKRAGFEALYVLTASIIRVTALMFALLQIAAPVYLYAGASEECGGL
jgi:hypothetical protein